MQTMAVIDPHPVTLDDEHLLEQCEVQRTRAGGPGGSHRNKVETAIHITHTPTGVGSMATERRSQVENLAKAIKRLRVNLALEVRSTPDPLAGPSELWRSRCHQGKMMVNPHHADFPLLLAEGLDVMHVCRGDARRAAAWMGCTMSQMVKFIKLEPRALEAINEVRARRGLHGLK